MKKVGLLLVAMILALALPASAQFGTIQKGPLSGNCPSAPVLGIDTTNSVIYACGDAHSWLRADIGSIGMFQGVTATAITTGNFTVLTGSALKIPAQTLNAATKTIRIKGAGVYTTGAASVLNVEISLCTVLGCGSGTVVSPAGCVVVGTNQANVLANGQFSFECLVITATTGSAGTLMAHATAGFNLGATASGVALSVFPDTATAVSAAVDLTVDEFVHPQFKFTTSNAGNTATLNQLTIEALN